jgi:hypothetical protein
MFNLCLYCFKSYIYERMALAIRGPLPQPLENEDRHRGMKVEMLTEIGIAARPKYRLAH